MKLITTETFGLLVSMLVCTASYAQVTDQNPDHLGDVTFTMNNGQSAQIHWYNPQLQSGYDVDNPFELKIWNSALGATQLEDLSGIEFDTNGQIKDFFIFLMTDMEMPDPSEVYEKPRHIVKLSQGTYQVSDVYFTMDSMIKDDWQIQIAPNHISYGSFNFTVGVQ